MAICSHMVMKTRRPTIWTRATLHPARALGPRSCIVLVNLTHLVNARKVRRAHFGLAGDDDGEAGGDEGRREDLQRGVDAEPVLVGASKGRHVHGWSGHSQAYVVSSAPREIRSWAGGLGSVPIAERTPQPTNMATAWTNTMIS